MQGSPYIFKTHDMNFLGRLSHTQIRYLLLPPLSLMLVHLVAYKKLPFEPGYQFPLITFFSVLLICIVCCETNTFSYHRLAKRLSISEQPVKTIGIQIATSLIITTFTFALMVYTLNYVVFGVVSPFTQFLSSLMVALLIIVVETMAYIIRDLRKMEPASEPEQVSTWTFHSGNKIFQVGIDEIAYVFSKQGLVYLVDKEGEKYLTHYNSLNDLAEDNDTSGFFRLNRQFMIRPHAVKLVEKDINQKLRVTLSPAVNTIPEEAMVSRYTSPEFKKWMKN